jgi:hypothetical protein
LDDSIEQRINNQPTHPSAATFATRKSENISWNLERKIPHFFVGQEIDVLDTEYIWCTGKILEVFNRQRES